MDSNIIQENFTLCSSDENQNVQSFVNMCKDNHSDDAHEQTLVHALLRNIDQYNYLTQKPEQYIHYSGKEDQNDRTCFNSGKSKKECVCKFCSDSIEPKALNLLNVQNEFDYLKRIFVDRFVTPRVTFFECIGICPKTRSLKIDCHCSFCANPLTEIATVVTDNRFEFELLTKELNAYLKLFNEFTLELTQICKKTKNLKSSCQCKACHNIFPKHLKNLEKLIQTTTKIEALDQRYYILQTIDKFSNNRC